MKKYIFLFVLLSSSVFARSASSGGHSVSHSVSHFSAHENLSIHHPITNILSWNIIHSNSSRSTSPDHLSDSGLYNVLFSVIGLILILIVIAIFVL
jgi:hypothetical protein